MRNGVPDGESVVEFPSGVEEAGGVERRSLIEHLRARIHVLERVPVSLALPPATDAGALSPACSLPLHPLSNVETSLSGAAISSPSPGKGEGGTARSAVPGGAHLSKAAIRPDPLPRPSPLQGEGVTPHPAYPGGATRDQACLLSRCAGGAQFRACRAWAAFGQTGSPARAPPYGASRHMPRANGGVLMGQASLPSVSTLPSSSSSRREPRAMRLGLWKKA